MSRNKGDAPDNREMRKKASFFTLKASKLLHSLTSLIEQIYPFTSNDKKKNPRLHKVLDSTSNPSEKRKEPLQTQNDFHDRREALRVSPDLICVVLVLPDEKNEKTCGDLLDVSIKGFSAEFGKSLGINECMMFSLMFEWNRTVEVPGVVVYEKHLPSGSYRCGVNFIFHDSQNEKNVREWIMEHQRYLQRKRAHQKSLQQSSPS